MFPRSEPREEARDRGLGPVLGAMPAEKSRRSRGEAIEPRRANPRLRIHRAQLIGAQRVDEDHDDVFRRLRRGLDDGLLLDDAGMKEPRLTSFANKLEVGDLTRCGLEAPLKITAYARRDEPFAAAAFTDEPDGNAAAADRSPQAHTALDEERIADRDAGLELEAGLSALTIEELAD